MLTGKEHDLSVVGLLIEQTELQILRVMVVVKRLVQEVVVVKRDAAQVVIHVLIKNMLLIPKAIVLIKDSVQVIVPVIVVPPDKVTVTMV